MTSLQASFSDIGVTDWSFGRVCVEELCIPVQLLVSRMALSFYFVIKVSAKSIEEIRAFGKEILGMR